MMMVFHNILSTVPVLKGPSSAGVPVFPDNTSIWREDALLVLWKQVGGPLTQLVLERRRKLGNLSFFLFFLSDSLAGSVKNMCKKGGNSVVS